MSDIDPRIRERKHRLPPSEYIGQKTVAFTVGVIDRHPLFEDPDVVKASVGFLADGCEQNNCEVPVYCFMPDHLHLMVRGKHEFSNIKSVLDSFKIRAGFWLRTKGYPYRLQANYYDHIIRSGEDWMIQARYIVLNPVRAGLIDDPFTYPHTGCIGMNRAEMLVEIFF
jgi:putative transposase